MSNDKNVFDIPIIPKKIKKEPKDSLIDDYDNPIIDDKVVEKTMPISDAEEQDQESISNTIQVEDKTTSSLDDGVDNQLKTKNSDDELVNENVESVADSSSEEPAQLGNIEIDLPDFVPDYDSDVIKDDNANEESSNDNTSGEEQNTTDNESTSDDVIDNSKETEQPLPDDKENDVVLDSPSLDLTTDSEPVDTDLSSTETIETLDILDDNPEDIPVVGDLSPEKSENEENTDSLVSEPVTEEIIPDQTGVIMDSVTKDVPLQSEGQPEHNNLEENANQDLPNDLMTDSIDNQTPDLVSLMSSELQLSSPENTQNSPLEVENANSDQPMNQEVPTEINQIDQLSSVQEITPMSLNATAGVIPDTLDQNYGVIGDDGTSVMPIIEPNVNQNENVKEAKKAKKEKKKKEKVKKEKPVKQPKNEDEPGKSKILKFLIPVFAFVAIFIGTIAFIAYRFFGAVDPVKTLAGKIREIGNEYNSIISNNELYKTITENKELAYSGKLSLNDSEKETVINLDGGLSKDTKKLSLSASINQSGEEDVNLAFVLLNGSAFIRLLKDSYFYRFPLENNIGLDDYMNLINLKPLFDTTSDVLLNNLSKDKLSSDVMRVNLIYKTKWVNNYTYTMNADKANQIIKAFLDSIKDESHKNFISNYIKPNLTSEAKIKFFVSLKGLEGMAVEYDQKQFKIISTGNSSYAIAYESYIINFEMVNDNINIKITNKKDNKVTSLNIKYSGEIKDSSAFGNLNIDYKWPNKNQNIKLENEVKSVSNVTLLSPTNFLNYSNEDVQEKFNEEYQKTLPYSKIIDELKK